MIISIVTKGVLMVGLTKLVKFIAFDKYSTSVKNADVELKIIRGNTLEKSAYGVFILSQIAKVVI